MIKAGPIEPPSATSQSTGSTSGVAAGSDGASSSATGPGASDALTDTTNATTTSTNPSASVKTESSSTSSVNNTNNNTANSTTAGSTSTTTSAPSTTSTSILAPSTATNSTDPSSSSSSSSTAPTQPPQPDTSSQQQQQQPNATSTTGLDWTKGSEAVEAFPDQKEAFWKIVSMFGDCGRIADEKIALVERAKNVVDRHLKRITASLEANGVLPPSSSASVSGVAAVPLVGAGSGLGAVGTPSAASLSATPASVPLVAIPLAGGAGSGAGAAVSAVGGGTPAPMRGNSVLGGFATPLNPTLSKLGGVGGSVGRGVGAAGSTDILAKASEMAAAVVAESKAAAAAAAAAGGAGNVAGGSFFEGMTPNKMNQPKRPFHSAFGPGGVLVPGAVGATGAGVGLNAGGGALGVGAGSVGGVGGGIGGNVSSMSLGLSSGGVGGLTPGGVGYTGGVGSFPLGSGANATPGYGSATGGGGAGGATPAGFTPNKKKIEKRKRFDEGESVGTGFGLKQQQQQQQQGHGFGASGSHGAAVAADADEDVYCICQTVSYGEMIGCDNPNCEKEWFHLACVGLKAPPEGVWLCPECAAAKYNASTSGAIDDDDLDADDSVVKKTQTLPGSAAEVEQRTASLSLPRRKAFAAQLAAKHRSNEATLKLARELLTTRPLEDAIPVLKENLEIAEDADDADWDVVENTTETKLMAPQSDAAKRMHLRLIGIFMAIALKHEQTLREILAHPSSAFKQNVKKALDAIEKEQLRAAQSPNPFDEFNAFFDAIRNAPLFAPSHSIKSRNEMWGAFEPSSKVYHAGMKKDKEIDLEWVERLPWYSGKVKSITNNDALKAHVTKLLLDCAFSHPPTTATEKDENNVTVVVPVIPKLVIKNLKELLQFDTARTVSLFTATFIQKKSKNEKFDREYLTPPAFYSGATFEALFAPDLRFWNNVNTDYVSALLPLFDVLGMSTSTPGSAFVQSSHPYLEQVLKANPTFAILSHLVTEATRIISNRIEFGLKKFQETSRFHGTWKAEITNGIGFISKILDVLIARVKKAATQESKLQLQRNLEDYLTATITNVSNVLSSLFSSVNLLPFENVKYIFHSINALKSFLMDIFYFPLLTAATDHQQLTLQVFMHAVILFNAACRDPVDKYIHKQLVTRTFNSLKSTLQPTPVSKYPKFETEAPYSGLVRSETAGSVVVDFLMQHSDWKLYFEVQPWMYTGIEQLFTKESREKYWPGTDALEEWVLDRRDIGAVIYAVKAFYPVALHPNRINADGCVVILDLMERMKNMSAEKVPAVWMDNSLKQLKPMLDTKVEGVRKLLTDNLKQSTIDKRVAAIGALVAASFVGKDVDEVIETYGLVFTRTKNEMRINMDSIYEAINRVDDNFYVQSATIAQAETLVGLFDALMQNNFSSVSVSPRVSRLIESFADECLHRYINTPSHPFFRFGIERYWKSDIHNHGSSAELPFDIYLTNPQYSAELEPELEKLLRKAATRGFELWKAVKPEEAKDVEKVRSFEKSVQDSAEYFGLFLIEEGQEERVVNEVMGIVRDKFESLVKETGEQIEFMDSICGHNIHLTMCKALGARWSKSTLLNNYFDHCVQVLRNADKVKKCPEDVFEWDSEECQRAESYLEVSCKKATKEYVDRFMDLKLQSTSATSEATSLYQSFKRNDYKNREAVVVDLIRRSPSGSALHIGPVLQFILRHRPDLLTLEHLKTKSALIGVFNQQNKTAKIEITLNPQRKVTPIPLGALLGWQTMALTERYQSDALDKSLPMNERVLATSRMINMSHVSVFEVATFLCSALLPSRVKEAVLMFLPKMDEPASTIDLLLSPIFLESNLSRTAIFSLKNTIQFLPDDKLVNVLTGLVPPPEGNRPTSKFNTFKEIIRVIAEYVHIPRVFDLLLELWGRDNLHVEVRIVLLQQIISLLSHDDETVNASAWKIVERLATDKETIKTYLEVGAVLLSVRNDDQTRRKKLISYPDVGKYVSGYARIIATAELPDEICDDYATKILAPSIVLLYNYFVENPEVIKNLRSTQPAVVLDLEARLTGSIAALRDNGFISATNAPSITSTLTPLLLHSANDDQKKNSTDFGCLATVMAECTGQESIEASQVIPTSWTSLSQAIEILVSKMFDLSLLPETRDLYKTRFETLSLIDSFNLPGMAPGIHRDAAIRKIDAMMVPILAIESVSEGAKLHFRDLVWARKARFLASHIEWIKSMGKTEKAAIEIVKQLAPEMLFEAVSGGFLEKLEYGVLEETYDSLNKKLVDCGVTESHLVPGLKDIFVQIFEGADFGANIGGFKSFRNEFRFALLDIIPGKYCGFEELIEFARDVLADDMENERCVERIMGRVTTKINSLLENAKQKDSYKISTHEAALLGKLLDDIGGFSEQAGYDKKSFWYKNYVRCFSSHTLLVLEVASSSAVKLLTHDLTLNMLRVWVECLQGLYSQRARGELSKNGLWSVQYLYSGQFGGPAVQPLLQAIYTAANNVSFKEDKKATISFLSLFQSSLSLFLYLVPESVGFIYANPGWKPFFDHVSRHSGREIAAIVLQHILNGETQRLDVRKLGTTMFQGYNESMLLFGRTKKSEIGSDARKSFTTVREVCAKHTEVWTSKLSLEYDTLASGKAVAGIIDSNIPILAQVPTICYMVPIEKISLTDPSFDEVEFVASYIESASCAVTNPRLYLTALIAAGNKATKAEIGPFPDDRRCENLVTQFKIKFSDIVGRTSTEGTGDVQFWNAIPVAYFVDMARVLVDEIAVYFDEKGEGRVANAVKTIAANLLADIPLRADQTTLHGVLLKENAVTGLNGEGKEVLQVAGLMPLMESLMLAGNWAVYKTSHSYQTRGGKVEVV
ncbi:hypothetical protein HDU99_003468 [Rhizoclosmatium hyalinum]|nr:hypothetical protein HDU99_003468 [Rhizoclosmatium hyalinum]